MKESIRHFAHEVFESDLVDKIDAISICDDHIDIQPATREMYTKLRRLTNYVGGLEINRDDFHVLRVQEHTPTVQLELTREDVDDLAKLRYNEMYNSTLNRDLRDKILDLYNNFDRYAE